MPNNVSSASSDQYLTDTINISELLLHSSQHLDPLSLGKYVQF